MNKYILIIPKGRVEMETEADIDTLNYQLEEVARNKGRIKISKGHYIKPDIIEQIIKVEEDE